MQIDANDTEFDAEEEFKKELAELDRCDSYTEAEDGWPVEDTVTDDDVGSVYSDSGLEALPSLQAFKNALAAREQQFEQAHAELLTEMDSFLSPAKQDSKTAALTSYHVDNSGSCEASHEEHEMCIQSKQQAELLNQPVSSSTANHANHQSNSFQAFLQQAAHHGSIVTIQESNQALCTSTAPLQSDLATEHHRAVTEQVFSFTPVSSGRHGSFARITAAATMEQPPDQPIDNADSLNSLVITSEVGKEHSKVSVGPSITCPPGMPQDVNMSLEHAVGAFQPDNTLPESSKNLRVRAKPTDLEHEPNSTIIPNHVVSKMTKQQQAGMIPKFSSFQSTVQQHQSPSTLDEEAQATTDALQKLQNEHAALKEMQKQQEAQAKARQEETGRIRALLQEQAVHYARRRIAAMHIAHSWKKYVRSNARQSLLKAAIVVQTAWRGLIDKRTLGMLQQRRWCKAALDQAMAAGDLEEARRVAANAPAVGLHTELSHKVQRLEQEIEKTAIRLRQCADAGSVYEFRTAVHAAMKFAHLTELVQDCQLKFDARKNAALLSMHSALTHVPLAEVMKQVEQLAQLGWEPATLTKCLEQVRQRDAQLTHQLQEAARAKIFEKSHFQMLLDRAHQLRLLPEITVARNVVEKRCAAIRNKAQKITTSDQHDTTVFKALKLLNDDAMKMGLEKEAEGIQNYMQGYKTRVVHELNKAAKTGSYHQFQSLINQALSMDVEESELSVPKQHMQQRQQGTSSKLYTAASKGSLKDFLLARSAARRLCCSTDLEAARKLLIQRRKSSKHRITTLVDEVCRIAAALFHKESLNTAAVPQPHINAEDEAWLHSHTHASDPFLDTTAGGGDWLSCIGNTCICMLPAGGWMGKYVAPDAGEQAACSKNKEADVQENKLQSLLTNMARLAEAAGLSGHTVHQLQTALRNITPVLQEACGLGLHSTSTTAHAVLRLMLTAQVAHGRSHSLSIVIPRNYWGLLQLQDWVIDQYKHAGYCQLLKSDVHGACRIAKFHMLTWPQPATSQVVRLQWHDQTSRVASVFTRSIYKAKNASSLTASKQNGYSSNSINVGNGSSKGHKPEVHKGVPLSLDLVHTSCRKVKLQQVVNLDLRLENLNSIAFLSKWCPDLQMLQLDANMLTSLETFGDLKFLKILSLKENQLVNLQGLRTLPNLTKIFLDSNRLETLTGIECVTSCLHTLSAKENSIYSLGPLKHCTGLEMLLVSGNKLKSLEGLESCHTLTTLDVSCNELPMLQGLQSCHLLTYLNASDNCIESWPDMLPVMLKTLTLGGNNIKQITGGVFLPHLVILSLQDNQLKSIPPLNGFPSLEGLDLSFNQLEDLQYINALAPLKSLKVLHLNDNPFAVGTDYTFAVRNVLPWLNELDSQEITLDHRCQYMQASAESSPLLCLSTMRRARAGLPCGLPSLPAPVLFHHQSGYVAAGYPQGARQQGADWLERVESAWNVNTVSDIVVNQQAQANVFKLAACRSSNQSCCLSAAAARLGAAQIPLPFNIEDCNSTKHADALVMQRIAKVNMHDTLQLNQAYQVLSSSEQQSVESTKWLVHEDGNLQQDTGARQLPTHLQHGFNTPEHLDTDHQAHLPSTNHPQSSSAKGQATQVKIPYLEVDSVFSKSNLQLIARHHNQLTCVAPHDLQCNMILHRHYCYAQRAVVEHSVVICQSAWRALVARRRYGVLIAQYLERQKRRAAAVKVQACWRGHKIRHSGVLPQLRHQLQLRREAEIQTQRRLQSELEARERTKQKAAVKIQAFARGMVVRKRLIAALEASKYVDDDDFHYSGVEDDFLKLPDIDVQPPQAAFQAWQPPDNKTHMLSTLPPTSSLPAKKALMPALPFYRNESVPQSSAWGPAGMEHRSLSQESKQLKSSMVQLPKEAPTLQLPALHETKISSEMAASLAVHKQAEPDLQHDTQQQLDQATIATPRSVVSHKDDRYKQKLQNLMQEWGFKDIATAEAYYKRQKRQLQGQVKQKAQEAAKDPNIRLAKIRSKVADTRTNYNNRGKQHGSSTNSQAVSVRSSFSLNEVDTWSRHGKKTAHAPSSDQCHE